ncbi:MAG: hypothetical protein V1820_06065 [archaeon]
MKGPGPLDSPVISIDDFLRKMQCDPRQDKGIYLPGGKHPHPELGKGGGGGYWGRWAMWNDAPWQPHCLVFGATLPEPIYYNIVDFMCGTTGLWWDYTKIREGIAASPTSRLQGEILGRQSFQRKDAKEMLATVQTMKTVILNLESDLEKIREQREAFTNKNPEQIKGLFVDNFGGPSRSWSALAHQVPIVKSALTWFYRMEEKSPDALKMKKKDKESDAEFQARWTKECQSDMEKQADIFVKSEELNPAVANYLKRKIQEYWTWRNSYQAFISKTYNSVIHNIRQQRVNLQLYMKWAQRNIQEAENMLIPFNEVDQIYGMFAEEFPQFAPLMYTVTDMFYDPEGKWPIVTDRMRPWLPCIAIQLLMSYNPDLQGNKFVRGFSVMSYGVIKKKDKDDLKKELARESSNFVEIMRTAGGFKEDDLKSLGLTETAEEKDIGEYEKTKGELDELSTLSPEDTAQGYSVEGANKEKMKALTKKLSELGQKIGVEEVADKGKTPEEAGKSIMKEMESWFKPLKTNDTQLYSQMWNWREAFLAGIKPMLGFFGNETDKVFDTRKRRASWFAYNTFFKVYHGLKASYGWLDYV